MLVSPVSRRFDNTKLWKSWDIIRKWKIIALIKTWLQKDYLDLFK